MSKNNFDIEIESISYTANCLLNNEITRAKSQIDVGTDNYEMGYYVGLLKAIQIIKGLAIDNKEEE